MRIEKNTGSYNERRYGKPWIARVDFSQSAKGDFIWGEWTGDHRNGGEGVLIIDADPGDIVALGQKDFRKERNSAPDFYEVTDSGKLDHIGDKGAAYKHFRAAAKNAPDRAALQAERDRLAARIAEIDSLLAE